MKRALETTNYLWPRSRLWKLHSNKFEPLLMGKDGWLKMKSQSPEGIAKSHRESLPGSRIGFQLKKQKLVPGWDFRIVMCLLFLLFWNKTIYCSYLIPITTSYAVFVLQTTWLFISQIFRSRGITPKDPYLKSFICS